MHKFHRAIGCISKVLHVGLGTTGRFHDTPYAEAVKGLLVPHATNDQMLNASDSTLWGLVAS